MTRLTFAGLLGCCLACATTSPASTAAESAPRISASPGKPDWVSHMFAYIRPGTLPGG